MGSNIKSLKVQYQNPYSSVKTENKRWEPRENTRSSYFEANFHSNYESVMELYYLNLDYVNLYEKNYPFPDEKRYQKAIQASLSLLS